MLKNDLVFKFAEFKYWFKRISNKRFLIYDIEGKKYIPDVYVYDIEEDFKIFPNLTISQDLEFDIKNDFTKYKANRPEYHIGNYSTESLVNSASNIESDYSMLILGVCLCKSFNESTGELAEDRGLRQASNLLDWIAKGDFYTAPSSTRFHDAHTCGLALHTLRVVENCCELWKLKKFRSIQPESFTLVALVHDWCKIGLYESYKRNVKDDNGNWTQQTAFKWNDRGPAFPFGHSVTSMFLASRFVSLSIEESLAIRWHMGAYRTCDEEFSELQTANESYPLVHMLQFADQLSIVKY